MKRGASKPNTHSAFLTFILCMSTGQERLEAGHTHLDPQQENPQMGPEGEEQWVGRDLQSAEKDGVGGGGLIKAWT